MRFTILLLIIGFMFIDEAVFAQGCSDAGFCTVGSIKHNSSILDSTSKQSVTVFFTNGIGDLGVYVFTPGIQYDLRFKKHWAIQSKLTGNYASGNLGSATGLGDLFLAGSYSSSSINKWKKTITGAVKIPLSNSNLKFENKPLPMGYQSSLGTFDLIGGLTITNNKWIFSVAIQQPLSGINLNTFLPEYWNTEEAFKYSPTNAFKRKADALLKAGYSLNPMSNWSFNIGLLAVYHLSNDTYINGNIQREPIPLKGSKGLTINGTASAHYKINNNCTFGILAGTPLVVRDIRPDGLTRSFVISPEFNLNF